MEGGKRDGVPSVTGYIPRNFPVPICTGGYIPLYTEHTHLECITNHIIRLVTGRVRDYFLYGVFWDTDTGINSSQNRLPQFTSFNWNLVGVPYPSLGA